MRSPLWSTLRSIMFVLCFCIFFGFTYSAHADCEITSYGFKQTTQYTEDGVPFFAGAKKDAAIKTLNILTNNDPSCDDAKVFVTVFSKNIHSDPDVPGSANKPLDNLTNSEHTLFKVSENNGTPQYGLALTLYAGEDGCYSHEHKDLKNRILAGIQSGTIKKSDYEYLNTTPETKRLYDYIFNDTYYPLNQAAVKEMWIIKKELFKKFGPLEDCGYFARVQLKNKMDTTVLTTSDGKPMAAITSDDYQSRPIVGQNFIGYMCNPSSAYFDVHVGRHYCNTTIKWEIRKETDAFTVGAIDTSDLCSANGVPTPGCYELLAPIPGLGTTINFDGINGQPPFALEQFFLAAINIIIGAISILAVLALMYYGYSMMRDRSRGNIAAISVDKTKLLNIFYGIGIILGSYVILNTINPELLVVAPKFDPIVFNAAEYVDDTPVSAPVSGGPLIPQLNVLPTFVHCPRSGGVAEFGKIVESLHGKTTYRLGGRGNPPYYGAEKNTDCPTPGLCYDCSGMVALIYACAGITKNIGATVSIFNNAEKINSIEMQSGNLLVNGKVANPGDLFGAQRWHVLMYMGGGISVDQTSDNNGRISGKGLRRMKSFIDWYNKAKERHEFYINRL